MTTFEMMKAQTDRVKRARWWRIPIIIALVLLGLFQVLALFQEPKAQAVSLGYFACAVAATVAWLARGKLQRWGRPTAPGAGRRFVLLGSMGAVWAETAFWAAEKLTGAVGVAASPNLILDLLVTMPWYVAMVAVLWAVHRRFRYHWTTVALLGGLYEIGGDGIVGHSLGGSPFTLGYLAILVFLYFWVFVIVYAPIVLPPVWALPLDDQPYSGPRWRKVLGTLVPLVPLVPYWFVLNQLFQ
jgi:hypothetical protein